jgi:hypothetical protein
MTEPELSKEELILKTVKMVITQVAKDTATEPGLKHPLSSQTIQDIRDCLVVISAREMELAKANGRSMDMRPRYTDEPKPAAEVVVPISSLKKQ